MSTMYRTTDPETSRQAAESLTPMFLSDTQREVYAFFFSRGEGTDYELEQALEHLKLSPSTLRKRRTELFQGGLLKDSGRTKQHGRSAFTVWKIVTAEDEK